ncbi:MAG: ABC transporter permease, partial [Actinobacteria bacterium]|nr:ABC transporter permease [Actinomycetota bacterium]
MRKNYLKNVFASGNFGLFVAALVLFAVLSIFSDSFLTSYNMYTIGRTLSLYAFIGLSQAIVLVVGDMNLSVGAIGGLATITAGYLIDIRHFPSWLAVLAALAVGIFCGALNGVITTKFGINAFIVTLATSFIFTGINFGFTQGFSFVNIPLPFTFIGKEKVFGIPFLFIFAVLCLIILSLFIKFSIAGRRLLAVGENSEAAKFSGINIDKIKMLSHILSGFIAALAAVLYLSRMGSASPVTGQDWLIISFAVAIIGGTGLSGGSITAFGLLIGAVIMVMIKNGLIMMQTDVYWEQAFLGILILIAVSIDRIRTVYNQKRL